MTPLDVLRGARELIAKPEAWTKGKFAQDAEGFGVDYESPSACRWCLLGALQRASGPDYGTLELAIQNQLKVPGISLFNDNPETTHADVLALLDRAIARLE